MKTKKTLDTGAGVARGHYGLGCIAVLGSVGPSRTTNPLAHKGDPTGLAGLGIVGKYYCDE